jgi:hypothetical protein
MRPYRVHWDDALGWLVDSDRSLPPWTLKVIGRWAADVQRQRLAGMTPGDARDALAAAIPLLDAGRLTVMAVDSGAGVEAFGSTQRTRPERAFSFPSRSKH